MLAFARDPYYDIFESFSQSSTTTSSLGIDWWNPTYDQASVYVDRRTLWHGKSDTFRRYQGSLTVVLESGLELSIPNELLVVPEKLIDDTGKVQRNSTFAEVLIQPTSGDNAGDTPVIGKLFFSSTYLFVNHDAGTFSVWQANGTTDTRLVSVGSDCSENQSEDGPTASTTTSNNLEATNAPQNDSPQTVVEEGSDSSRLSTGVIVGMVVGIIGAVAAVVALIFFCLVRKRKKQSGSDQALITRNDSHEDRKSDLELPTENGKQWPRRTEFPMSELTGVRDVGELDSRERKYGYLDHKPRTLPPPVYELGSRAP